jgi:hypothetical protein
MLPIRQLFPGSDQAKEYLLLDTTKLDPNIVSTLTSGIHNRQYALSAPLTELTVSSKLPIELRTMIWKLAIIPRVVHVKYLPYQGYHLTRIVRGTLRQGYSHLLFVDRYFRESAKKLESKL